MIEADVEFEKRIAVPPAGVAEAFGSAALVEELRIARPAHDRGHVVELGIPP